MKKPKGRERRTIKDRRALTIYFHALTLDPVRENKKVNAFSVCASWRHCLRLAATIETKRATRGKKHDSAFCKGSRTEALRETPSFREATKQPSSNCNRETVPSNNRKGADKRQHQQQRQASKDRRALTIYFHALTLDPVRENKKVNAFSVCVVWRCLRLEAAARACQE